MAETFMIEFPNTVADSELDSLRNELRELDEVSDVGGGDTRAIDPASLMMWVTLGSTAITAAGGGVGLFERIAGMFRRKGIKGAKITLANGTSFSADEISAEDLQNLLKASKG